jgi:GNAT superfamily N-acetyltransferase
MISIRRATVEDAGLIAEHRRAMFFDAGLASLESMDEMVATFTDWVQPRLTDETYRGYFAEEDGAVVAAAGMWLVDFPPHWMDPQPRRAYLLNFYTAPSHRGQGLAPRLLRVAIDEARGLGIKVVTLHASKFGKPIYEKHGFKPTSEMMLRQDVED